MKSLEDLDKEYAEKRAELVGGHEVAATLPVVPYMVNFGHKRNPWVSYEVDTLKEAVALADKFPDKLAYVNAKATFRHICPEELIEQRYRDDPKYTAVEIVDGVPFIEADSGEGYRSFALLLFVRRGEQILRITIKVSHPPYEWMPRCIFSDYDNVRRTAQRKHYPNVPGARLVQWSGGGNSVRASYIWGCDDDMRAALTTLPEFKGVVMPGTKGE